MAVFKIYNSHTFQNIKDAAPVQMIDPSLVFRPEKAIAESGWEFRRFDEESDDPKMQQVKETYLKMHTNQTVDYVKRKVFQDIFYIL